MLVTTQLLYTGKNTIMLQYCIQVFHSAEHIALLKDSKILKLHFKQNFTVRLLIRPNKTD